MQLKKKKNQIIFIEVNDKEQKCNKAAENEMRGPGN